MSDLSGRLSGGQAISGSLSGGSTLRGGLSMGGVSPAVLLDKADVITDTASGAIASIPDGMASPVLGLDVDIEPIQAGTGDPSPDNIRPISGRSEVNVTRTGKNLLQDFERYSITNYISSTVFLKAGQEYTVSFESDIVPTAIYLRKGSYTSEAEQYKYNSKTWTFTPLESRLYMFQFYKSGSTGWDDHTFSNLQLELGSTVSSYEPYTGQTVTIQLGQTVYGGTVDVTRGKLRVTYAIKDFGDFTWNYNSGSGGYFSPSTLPPKAYGITNIISDVYLTSNSVSVSGMPNCSIKGANNSSGIYVRDNAYNDGSVFKTARTGNKICFETSTPIEIDLTPDDISILQGTNNIWADSGDVSVDYRCDTKKYILKKIAEALNA